MGSKIENSVSRTYRYYVQQYTLKDALDSYSQEYARQEKEYGAGLIQQAQTATTEQLIEIVNKGKGKNIGAKAIEAAYNERLKGVKEGRCEGSSLNYKSGSWGFVVLKDHVTTALRITIAQEELKRRKVTL